MFEDLAAEMKQEQDRNEKISSSAVQSYGVNPDQHAGNIKLARKAGMPPALMPEINEDARLRVLLDQIDAAPPAVTRFVSDPDNLKVSHDDIENMSALERTFDVLKKSALAVASSPWSTSSGLWAAPRLAGDLLQKVTKPLSDATGLPDFGGNIADWSRYFQQGAKGTAEKIKGDTSGAGMMERGLYSGMESLGQNLLNLPLTILSGGSATPMLASMSLSTGGQAYGDARDKDKGVLSSLIFGTSQGAIEYATEMLPALALVNNLKAKSGIAKMARDMFATEVPGEQVATLLQDLNEWAILNPDKPFSSYVEQRPAAAMETLIATIVGTGGMVVTAKGLEKIGASVDKFQTATDNKNFLLALGDGVQASKLRERMPEKLQELIRSMKEEHGTPEHAYVDANKLTELWQSNGFDPQVKAAEMFSDPSGYAEALATGSEVAIPLEEFAQKFTGEGYYKALIEDVRLGSGSSTMKEAEEWEKSGRDEAIKELIEEADGIAPTPSDLKVYDDVVGQLIGTGMERGTAERNALVMKSVFRTLAARTGQDAHDLYKEYGLKITRPLPEALSKRLSVDLSLDPLLDRLREGKIPQDKDVRGQSLVEYLRSKGVQDSGGELAALDPDAGIKGKAKKLIKTDGLDMDRARLLAVDDGYLPEGATIRDFLGAISNDLAGRGVYSVNNLNTQLADDQMSLQQMKEFLDAHDIDVQGMTNEEIKAALQETQISDAQEMNQLDTDGIADRIIAAEGGVIYASGISRDTGTSDNRRKDTSRDLDSSGKVQEQFALFLPEGSPEAKKPEVITPKKESGVRKVQVGTMYSAIKKVRTPSEAAHVAFPLASRAQEALIAIVTNKKGDILGVIQHTTGSLNQSIVHPRDLLGVVHDFEGAAEVWLAHNHPSGDPTFSSEDKKITDRIAEVLDGSAIRLRGMLAVGLEGGGMYYEGPGAGSTAIPLEDITSKGERKKKLETYDREIIGLPDGPRISSSIDLSDYVKTLGTGASGIIVVNGKNVPSQFVPMTLTEMKKLRTGEAGSGSSAIMQAFHKGNGAAMFMVAPGLQKDYSAVQNIASFGEVLGGKLLDGIDTDTGYSITGSGNMPSGGSTFYQSDNTKRAFIRFGADRQFNIGFLENADLSSFLHESAHFYFEVMADLVGREEAPQQLREDFQTLLDYVGAVDYADVQPYQHETIARSFEAYLMEGKAPSVELQSVFSRMKAWLVQVYKEIRKLNVKLNDDVRGVFDRLVASDEEIEAARTRQGLKEVFATAEDMGVSEAEFAIYRRQGEKVHAAQIEKLEREYMAELTRQNKLWWHEGLMKIAEEVDGETQDYPVYVAIQVLTKGVTFSGEEADLKLDRKTLEKQYGKTLVKRLPKGIYAKEGGLSADQVAEMTGFESGQEMIEAMITAPSRKEYVKAEADRRMRALHGDMLTDGSAADEATLAVHTDEQVKVLHEELRAMRKLQVTAEKVSRAKEGENRAARKESLGAIPPAEFFKDLARDMVAKKMIEELLPHRYQQAEAKAAREAFEAAAKKDWSKAAEAKQRQILNHYLYKEAANIKKMVDKQVGKWNDLIKKSDKRLAASRDMNIVTAARAVLAAYGIGDSPDKALAALNLVQQYDPNLYESLQMAVDVATQEPKPWKKLQLTEFIGLMDAVNNLWHLSRRSKVAMIDGLSVGLDEINDDLHLQIGGRARPFSGMGKRSAVTDLQKLKIGFLGMGAALKRVEHWAVEMDRGDSGPFHNFILRPIYNAVTQYKAEKKPVIEKLREIFSRLDSDVFSDKKLAAPELGYTFKNKGELLHAILHTGNESNLKKLLVGRNWADAENEQRALDRSKWDKFLERMHKDGTLTEADYVFAQEVWDLLESIKAGAQKAHHDMYGYYFAEITAEPVVTPFGTFRGGYVPAITDPYLVESAAERADQENLLQDNASSMFPATTGKGFTMSRVAGYNKPLLLDLGLMANHVDKVLRFSTMGPAIQDVGRIIGNTELKETFAEINPAWSSEMLVPWLKRTARQTVETKSSGWGGKAMDAVFRGLRRRTGLQLMAANIGNAAQQLTGLFPTMAKVSPRKVGAALVQFSMHPMELTSQITDKSPWMADRLDNEISQISGELRDILTQSKYEKAQDFGMRAGYWASGAAQHIVDVITWQAAYDEKISEGEDEKESVQYADSVVRQTQGSFAPEDASNFEAKSPFVRLFTQFYSYFNMISNLAVTESRNAIAEMGWKGGSPRLFYIYMMTFALPSFFAELIMSAMRGKIDDDDDGEYIDDILMMFFTGQGRAATALIPGVGQVINSGIGKFTKTPQDDRMSVSPAVSALEGSVGVGKDLYDVLLDGKELKRAHVRDVFTLAGMITGLPFAAAARPLGYMMAEESGATEPANNIDYIRGLMTGYAPK